MECRGGAPAQGPRLDSFLGPGLDTLHRELLNLLPTPSTICDSSGNPEEDGWEAVLMTGRG